MARHKSALKKHRQSLLRRQRNRHHRSRVRSAVRRFREAVAAGDVEQARNLLPATLSLLDRTAKLGAIHDNVAARAKSRLTRAVNQLSDGS
jgi:small subunit ribosomal protein S20